MSQGELADAIDASQREISRYEHGRTFPQPERLEAIASALGISVSDMFSGAAATPRFSGEVLRVALLLDRAAKQKPEAARRILKAIRALLQ